MRINVGKTLLDARQTILVTIVGNEGIFGRRQHQTPLQRFRLFCALSEAPFDGPQAGGVLENNF